MRDGLKGLVMAMTGPGDEGQISKFYKGSAETGDENNNNNNANE